MTGVILPRGGDGRPTPEADQGNGEVPEGGQGLVGVDRVGRGAILAEDDVADPIAPFSIVQCRCHKWSNCWGEACSGWSEVTA